MPGMYAINTMNTTMVGYPLQAAGAQYGHRLGK